MFSLDKKFEKFQKKLDEEGLDDLMFHILNEQDVRIYLNHELSKKFEKSFFGGINKEKRSSDVYGEMRSKGSGFMNFYVKAQKSKGPLYYGIGIYSKSEIQGISEEEKRFWEKKIRPEIREYFESKDK